MVEVRIPKELNQYEPKLIGPFTSRQLVTILIIAPLMVVTFNFVRSFASFDAACISVLPFATIAAFFGWTKPYGMKFEVFLASIFVNVILAPAKRPYVTENFFSEYTDIVLTDEKMEEIEKDLAFYDSLLEENGLKPVKKAEPEEYILEDFYFDPDAVAYKPEPEVEEKVVPQSDKKAAKAAKKKEKQEKKKAQKAKKAKKKEKYVKSKKAIK